MKSFSEQDLRYMRSEPTPQDPFEGINEDRKLAKRNRQKPVVREVRARYSPLREHVSHFMSYTTAPNWLVVRWIDGIYPMKRSA
jgi:hypothetical protein